MGRFDVWKCSEGKPVMVSRTRTASQRCVGSVYLGRGGVVSTSTFKWDAWKKSAASHQPLIYISQNVVREGIRQVMNNIIAQNTEASSHWGNVCPQAALDTRRQYRCNGG